MRRLTAARTLGAGLGLALQGGCAQQGPPPGGPPDPTPPVIVRVSPDSGAVNVRPDEVEFRFDEVVSHVQRFYVDSVDSDSLGSEDCGLCSSVPAVSPPSSSEPHATRPMERVRARAAMELWRTIVRFMAVPF